MSDAISIPKVPIIRAGRFAIFLLAIPALSVSLPFLWKAAAEWGWLQPIGMTDSWMGLGSFTAGWILRDVLKWAVRK